MTKREASSPEFDPKQEILQISKFIKDYVRAAKVSGIVVAISGGIDSAVSSFLAVKALGRSRVRGLLLFEDDSRNSIDYKDAKEIISKLRIKWSDISITPAFSAFRYSLRRQGFRASKYTLGNIKARCRMIFLYAFANEHNLIVLGTGDKSEESLGYFTKYGDGGVDLQPIAHLYKTQVRILAKKLGVPQQIIEKPSSPHLWKGHEATDEIPADYPTLDKILPLLYDTPTNPEMVARKLGISIKVLNDVSFLHEKSEHKRKIPPSLLGIP
jgi:NAD+ synthase